MDTLHKISVYLDKQGKSQKDLTDYLGLKRTAYTQWKLGKNKSYLKHIGKIGDFLGVSVDHLLSDEGTETKKSPKPLSKEDLETLEKIKQLDDEGVALVRQMIDKMLGRS